MSLPKPIEALWNELQAVRAEVLAEVRGLSQTQMEWRPREAEWSVGEIVDHLTIAEIATGKLTTKLTKEAAAAGTLAPWPTELTALTPLASGPAGNAEAPAAVRPSPGKPAAELVHGMEAARTRTRESIEKLATMDPRRLRFQHFRLGDLDLSQWWQLQAHHDAVHLRQIRDVKRQPGFPKA